MSFRIAVVGGGVFGSTTAIRISENNFKCDLFEMRDDLLLCASRVNQYRFHQGYHYPRSLSTVNQLRKTSNLFAKEYKEAINKDFKHLYSLSASNSKVDRNYYIDFLKKTNLNFKIIDCHKSVKPESSQLIIEVNEALIDYQKLKQIVKNRISKIKNINLKLSTKFTKDLIDDYDLIINCGYGLSNEILPESLARNYKYQLLEKIVVKPPESLKDLSLVVVDGPFMCIDPIPNTDFSILGNVKLAILNTFHGSNTFDKGSSNADPWKDITNQEKSKFKEFIEHGKDFINDFDKCSFEYSMVG